MKRKLLLSGLIAAMLGAPISAQASVERAHAPISGENALSGNSDWVFYAGIATVALGVYLLVDDDDDEPVSA